MDTLNVIEGSIGIHATPAIIWNILTNPEKIILYLGSSVSTDWQEGSSITWEGEFHGNKFINKGKVLENVPNKLLKFLYWSGFSGVSDTPENYSTITYRLESNESAKTVFTYIRENIPTVEEKEMFEGHLPHMLETIKKLAEA